MEHPDKANNLSLRSQGKDQDFSRHSQNKEAMDGSDAGDAADFEKAPKPLSAHSAVEEQSGANPLEDDPAGRKDKAPAIGRAEDPKNPARKPKPSENKTTGMIPGQKNKKNRARILKGICSGPPF